jgi:hypothetical protein
LVGWGEKSEARHVDMEYPEKLSVSNLKILNSINTSLRPRRRIKPLNIRSDNSVMQWAVPLVTRSANRKREWSGNREYEDNGGKKWKV